MSKAFGDTPMQERISQQGYFDKIADGQRTPAQFLTDEFMARYEEELDDEPG